MAFLTHTRAHTEGRSGMKRRYIELRDSFLFYYPPDAVRQVEAEEVAVEILTGGRGVGVVSCGMALV